MSKYDCRVVGCRLYLLPVETRVPLKFGTEVLSSVNCARVQVTVEGADGKRVTGWGETPLSVQWVWPSSVPYNDRYQALADFTRLLTREFAEFESAGHAMEVSHDFHEDRLDTLRTEFNSKLAIEPLPYLAALVAFSPLDIALHDAYGKLHDVPTYSAYCTPYLNRDLASFLDGDERFADKYPADYLRPKRIDQLPAWHLVGGLDPVKPEELTGSEPDDGHPVLLADWIDRDGLTCLKVKLRGNDKDWDYQRLVEVGTLGLERGVEWLTADFNCTVTDPQYVVEVLDKLAEQHPDISRAMLYVEQPFPYELAELSLDVRSVSQRKPLFLDESAHDWRVVRLGHTLGWTGVALKTCKTQTGALLSLCWAQENGMQLMVQDLTNPMLAQIPHCLLAAHAPTIMGVETNGMQFYPEASQPEAEVHTGLYSRRNGQVDLSTVHGPGFGYRVDEIERTLPAVDTEVGKL